MLEPLPAQTVAGRKRKAEDDSQSQASERQPLTRRVLAGARKAIVVSSKPQQPLKPARATPRAPLQTQTQQITVGTTARQTPGTRGAAAPGRPSTAPAGRVSRPSAAVRPPALQAVKSAARATTSSNTHPAGTGKDAGADALDIRTKFNLPQKKKRAAWDVKGRLQDMEELTNAMRQLQDKYTVKLSGMTNKLEAYTAQSEY